MHENIIKEKSSGENTINSNSLTSSNFDTGSNRYLFFKEMEQIKYSRVTLDQGEYNRIKLIIIGELDAK